LLDFFKLAEENTAELDEQTSLILSNIDKKSLYSSFLSLIEERKSISINLKNSDLKGFLVRGEYNNINEFCNDDKYIEAITTAPILIHDLDCIRIKRKDYEKWFDTLFKGYSVPLEDDATGHIGDFRDILELLDSLKIKLEVLDED
jgi:hypothetical protein